MFPVVKRADLTSLFVSQVEREIFSGQYQAGDKLPPLREIARSTGFSRSVINAGVVELRNKGLVNVYPRQGVIVADWRKQGTLSALDAMIAHDLLDLPTLTNLLDARRFIECECAGLAAVNAGEADIRALKEILALEEQAASVDDKVRNDWLFHVNLCAAGGNITYVIIINSMRTMIDTLVRRFYERPDVYSFVTAMHRDIVTAIERADESRASLLTLRLLRHGENAILEQFEPAGQA